MKSRKRKTQKPCDGRRISRNAATRPMRFQIVPENEFCDVIGGGPVRGTPRTGFNFSRSISRPQSRPVAFEFCDRIQTETIRAAGRRMVADSFVTDLLREVRCMQAAYSVRIGIESASGDKRAKAESDTHPVVNRRHAAMPSIVSQLKLQTSPSAMLRTRLSACRRSLTG